MPPWEGRPSLRPFGLARDPGEEGCVADMTESCQGLEQWLCRWDKRVQQGEISEIDAPDPRLALRARRRFSANLDPPSAPKTADPALIVSNFLGIRTVRRLNATFP